ncbi:unnamed protein product [Schistosoma curassoni]|uniref:SWIRM domain-containing protein n=1 Tax=Schistosoma curassoni TaxID=6186 RepID=A0A183L4D1_9TREM|nr:unnamed protein product [Schistosoma curassoni]
MSTNPVKVPDIRFSSSQFRKQHPWYENLVNRKNWHNVYCKLLNNGWFQWFDDASSTSPKRSVEIRRVASFLAFGEPFHRVPCNPTSLTASEIPLAFGVLYGPHMGTQMAWFACPDQATLRYFFSALTEFYYLYVLNFIQYDN